MESNIIIFYKGVFNDEILNRIGNFIRQGFSGNTKAEKRLFALFIELAQNISYYSLERFIIGNQVGEFGIGEITLLEKSSYFELVCQNLAPASAVKKLTERSQNIQKMDRNQLREYKKKLRSEPRQEAQKGGNIGLVQIALKSDYPIEVSFHQLNETTFWYQMKVKINKN